MTVSGNWILHFSWGGTGAYAQTPLTFNANRTFSGSYTGAWRQQNGTVMLSFDGGPAKYGGSVNGNIGSGVMSTFSGLDGYWYLSKEGTTGIALDLAVADASAQPAAADGSTRVAAQQFPATEIEHEATVTATSTRRRTTAKAGAGSSRGK